MPMPAPGEQADIAGAMQDGGAAAEDQDDPNEIQKLKPISQRRFIGEDIVDLKWAFNDTFLLVVTVTNKLFILDSLCHAFNMILPQHTDTSSR